MCVLPSPKQQAMKLLRVM